LDFNSFPLAFPRHRAGFTARPLAPAAPKAREAIFVNISRGDLGINTSTSERYKKKRARDLPRGVREEIRKEVARSEDALWMLPGA